jgi:hypothetical protein
VVPPEGTLRTCSAWADGVHFSGCRGEIEITDCEFSGLQDDPVNVHGTHLRIQGAFSERQLDLRFMHPQTYGFAAFQPGDEVAVINAATLREYSDNPRRRVTDVERLSDKLWRLTLDGPLPDFEPRDVIDNLSWYPDLVIRGCRVEMAPTRGFLVTTRGRVRIEGNVLRRCRMPAILIENDANGWFESGPVRDMRIEGNTFVGSGIRIHPRVKEGQAAVHEGIQIIGNRFEEGAGIEAHHVQDLRIEGNRSVGGALSIKLDDASVEAVIDGND